MSYVGGSTRAEAAPAIVGRLRAHCLTAHTRLDERISRFEWLATPETYAAMLERVYGFYVHAEPELEGASSGMSGLDLRTRRKTPLLVADLTALGRTPRDLRALPRIARMPRFDTAARALGALYVLEGATLGGKVIEQEVGRRLALDRSTGTAFFGAYGEDAARQWKRFGLVLEREGMPLDVDEICDAAEATFAAFEDWLVT